MTLRALFPVLTSDERPRFVYTAVGFMCVASAALIARAAGDTLFLGRYRVDLLSYMYLGTALVVSTASYAFGAFAGRIPVGRLIVLNAGLLVLVTLGLRVVLLHPWGGFRIAAYLLGDLIVNVPIMLFWSFAALVFNPREAKQLFGFVGAGGTLACILSGFFIRPYAARFGTENLLLPVALLLAGFAGTVAHLSRLEAGRLRPAASGRRPGYGLSTPRYYAGLLKTVQVRHLTLLVLAATVALTLMDYQFKAGARGHYQDEELAGFFGSFYASASIVALGIQLFLVHRILGKWGVLPALCILPASLLFTSAGTAAMAVFAWIVAAKFVIQIFAFTIDSAALQILYLGVKKQSRSQVRAFVDGICRPLSMAATAAALITVGGIFSLHRLAIGAAVASALWLLLIRGNYSAYVSALVESLGARRLDLSDATSSLQDRAFERHLRRALSAASDEEVPYLLGVLPDLDTMDWTPEFRELLQRETPSVKVAALHYLRERGNKEDLQAVLVHLQHPDPEVRAAAVRTAIALDGHEVAESLERCLEDPHPAVRAVTVAGLINAGDLDGLLFAGVALKAMLASENPDVRIAAADALSHIQHEGLIRPLLTLLEDPEDGVRLAALSACTRRSDSRLIPAVVPLLFEPFTAAAAAETLGALGPKVLDYLIPYLDLRSMEGASVGVHRIPAILARIGDPSALPALRNVLGASDLHLRREAVRAYGHLLRRVPSIQPYLSELDATVGHEMDAAGERLQILRKVMSLPATEVLCDALRREYNDHLHNAFLLLDVRTPGVDMDAIYLRLSEGTGESRANAIEILDNVLEGALKAPLLSLLESDGAETSVGVHEDGSPWLCRLLMSGASEWATVGALYAAAQNGLDVCIGPARRALHHPHSIVRETALYAVSRLGSPEILSEACTGMAEDPAPNVRRLAESLCHR